jgi:hypothetical protein
VTVLADERDRTVVEEGDYTRAAVVAHDLARVDLRALAHRVQGDLDDAPFENPLARKHFRQLFLRGVHPESPRADAPSGCAPEPSSGSVARHGLPRRVAGAGGPLFVDADADEI